MAFVKGSFYRCVDNTTPFGVIPITVGKVYEAQDLPTLGFRMVLVEDDHGNPRWVDEGKFDSTPVSQIAPSPVAAHAAYKASLAQPAPAAPAVKSGTFCACGQKAELKKFPSFEYWYCSACKTEVGGKYGNTANLSIRKHIPAGIAALKGEEVICDNCNGHIAVLVGDLPALTGGLRPLSSTFINRPKTPACVTCGDYWGGVHGDGRLFVKGRGWV